MLITDRIIFNDDTDYELVWLVDKQLFVKAAITLYCGDECGCGGKCVCTEDNFERAKTVMLSAEYNKEQGNTEGFERDVKDAYNLLFNKKCPQSVYVNYNPL